MPDSLSTVAYLEVLDRENNPVMQAKVALDGGNGSGSLEIPFRLSSGNYRLRAYTNWMKNFSPEDYFEKQLTIVNTTRPLPSLENDTQPGKASVDLQFFPEGGDLVQGLRSRVAFKAVNREGKGVDFRGIVISSRGDTLARFLPLKYGMGSFFFTPAGNEGPYTAVVITASGDTLQRQLPEVRRHGYVLQVRERAGGTVSVVVKGNDPAVARAPVYLFVHTRQRICLAAMQPLENGHTEFRIDKTSLGEGVSHITLFNAALKPVAERLYFKRPQKRLCITPDASRDNYGPRAKVDLKIAARDANGKDLSAQMSVAVYRLDSLEGTPQADMFSWLWLSSDLRGRIENPGYYLDSTGPEADEALDHLMLTQGWRRFNWKDIMERRPPPLQFVPEYQGHILSGKVVDRRTGQPVPGKLTYLSVPGKQIQLQSSLSDGQGRVWFNMRNIYGPAEIVVQTGKDSTYLVQVINPFSEEYASDPPSLFLPGKDAAQALRLRNKAMHVQNTYSGTALRQYIPHAKNTGAFYYKPDKTYFLDDYVRFTSMEEVMREYVPEVIVRKRGGEFHFRTMDIPVFERYGNSGPDVFFREDPLVLLDGVPVFDIDRIISYDPLKVEKMEIVGSKYYQGPMAAAGIISYTTYKGNLEGFMLDPGSLVMDYEGLQLQREYYMPAYGNGTQPSGRLPDFRTLLYWSPDVTAGSISFYTSDIPGNYLVYLQGITTQGQAGSGSFRFSVTK